jgi:hypothetical protein
MKMMSMSQSMADIVDASVQGGRPEAAMDEPDVSSNAARAKRKPIFDGIPIWSGDRAILFDSQTGSKALPPLLTRIRLEAEGDVEGITLLLFLEDMQLPRVRVRLADMKALGGVRPINLQVAGKRVQLVLVNEGGGPASGKITLSLE